MSDLLPFTTSITCCARCQLDHADLRFEVLANGPDDVSHYGICPTNGQPILMLQQSDARPAAPVEAGEGWALRDDERDWVQEQLLRAENSLRIELEMEPGSHRACHAIECEIKVLRAALKPAPVSQGGAVSEDGFMACAEHGPYHVDDSEAFQCPACGAAIKAPAAPASQGADND